MPNELILIFSVVFIYGAALLGYKFFGKTGLYCISVIATILANIEVTIMINAFGMEQTLGNVLFAVTFLITDILSECEGKKAAQTEISLKVPGPPYMPVYSVQYSSLCFRKAGCFIRQAQQIQLCRQ